MVTTPRRDIRPLTNADRPAFRALRLLALTVCPDEFMMTADEEREVGRLNIESALEKPSAANLFLGAFDGDNLIATGGLLSDDFLKTRHVGRITSLFVHPDHRRRGIARRLLDRLLADAARARLDAVRLEVVAQNAGAIRLYESLGFVSYGCEPAAYKLGDRQWDLLLMTRTLP